MLRVFLRNPVTQFCLVVILLTVFAGVFAPLLAPHAISSPSPIVPAMVRSDRKKVGRIP